MSIVRWDPFRDLVSLRQAMDRLFEESFVHPSRIVGLWGDGMGVPLDVYHTPEALVVKASLPGVKPEEVEITVTGDSLTIKGEVKAEEETKREDYYCQERRYGSFSRSVRLPEGLRTEKAEATFEHGVLTLTIPKAEEVKPRTIKVKALEGKK